MHEQGFDAVCVQRASSAQQQNVDIKQLFPYAFADMKAGIKATLNYAVSATSTLPAQHHVQYLPGVHCIEKLSQAYLDPACI